jgi:prevent-host-death family protein
MGKNMTMKTISVPIVEGRTDLCQLIKKVEAGAQIIFTSYGKPKAVLSAYRPQGPPWRVDKPDDPKRYGDLQSPVMEDWR